MYGLLTASYTLMMWAFGFAQRGIILGNEDKSKEEVGKRMLSFGGPVSVTGIVLSLVTLYGNMPDQLATAIRWFGVGMVIAGFNLILEGFIVKRRKAFLKLKDVKIAAALIIVASIACYVAFAVTL